MLKLYEVFKVLKVQKRNSLCAGDSRKYIILIWIDVVSQEYLPGFLSGSNLTRSNP